MPTKQVLQQYLVLEWSWTQPQLQMNSTQLHPSQTRALHHVRSHPNQSAVQPYLLNGLNSSSLLDKPLLLKNQQGNTVLIRMLSVLWRPQDKLSQLHTHCNCCWQPQQKKILLHTDCMSLGWPGL